MIQAETGGSTVRAQLDQHHDDTSDYPVDSLPTVVVGPVVGRWVMIRFRVCAELDELIRMTVDKPHRRWAPAAAAWRIRLGHTGIVLAAMHQRGVKIVDVRKASS